MYSLLSLLSVSLFASNHWCTFSKSTFMCLVVRQLSCHWLVKYLCRRQICLLKMRSGNLAGFYIFNIIRTEVAQD
jgi:hypothetical protein